MKSKSLIALSILCLALGACATTDSDADDPNIAKAADHANQSTPAARADYVAYSSLTPNTEQETVTTTTTEPVWTASVENPPADSTLTQSSTIVAESTTSDSTIASGNTSMASGSTITDDTANLSGSTTTTTQTTTTTTSTPSSMASSSADDEDDDTTTTTATETRTRLRKD